jgi:competence protein ComEC
MAPPIVRFAIAYGAGLTAGLVFLPPLSAVLVPGAVGLALVATGRRDGAVLVLTLAVGGLAGRSVADGRRSECAVAWRPGPHAAVAVLDEPLSQRGRAAVVVTSTVEHCRGSIDARFPEPSAEHPAPPAGATVVVVGMLDDVGMLHVRHWRVLPGRALWLPRIRSALTDRITRLYGPRAPLVEALLLGRRDDVARGLRQEFADSGLAHLLAIAGLHVGFLVGWVILLAGLIASRRRALIIAAVFAWCYVSLLGFPPPATRAAAFVSIRTIAHLRERHPAPLAALGVGALVVVAIDPQAIATAGFWMSISAVWGMGWVMEGGRTMQRLMSGGSRAAVALRRHAVLRGLTEMALASVAATCATAPVAAYTFGSVAPIGVVANMVAIPLAGLAVPGVFLSLLVSPLAAGAGLALSAVEQVARIAANFPLGHVTGTPGLGFAAPWAILLALAVWVRRDRPTLIVARRRLIAGWAAALWAVAVGTVPLGHDAAPSVMIYVLDVGQGDGIVVRTPRGHWIVIDAGPRTPQHDAGRDVVVPFLRKQGVRQLDLAIPTHGDADHLGGMPTVVRALDPALVLDNGQPVGTALFLDYQRALIERDPEWHAARTGDMLTVDSVTLTVLSPSAAWEASHLETNENSVVLEVRYGAFTALLTGDMDSVTEAALLPTVPHVDLLKVAHHGSATSTTAAWLERVRPQAAVISVAAKNSYGHPSPATLLRLAVRDIPVWRTDQGGTVTIRSDGRYFDVSQRHPHSLLERLRCLIPRFLLSIDPAKPRPSANTSPMNSVCGPTTPVSFRVSSPA